MSDLAYEYGMIEGMASELKRFVDNLELRLRNDVESAFNGLLANGWSGAGADSFQTAKTEWGRRVDEMQTTLTQLKTALSTAGTDMNATDQSLIGLFT
jgi:WXG100 family type VII secretion target